MTYSNFASDLNDRAGQTPNSAGGYSYAVDKWTRLNRFLILGSDAGSYYITPQALTLENANAVIECLKENPTRVRDTIVEISKSGRAAKNSPAIFALAIACTPKYSGHAFGHLRAMEVISEVCRTGTHLFEFMEYVTALRGTGRGLRTALSNWYTEKSLESLQYQLVKYQQRNGWSHRDILRLAHPVPQSREISEIFHWVTNPDSPEVNVEPYDILFAFEQAKIATEALQIVDLIQKFSLPWEAIPTQWLKDPNVRMTLLEKMPIMAMIRQLGIYSSLGLTEMQSRGEELILASLNNAENISRSRIHPFQILLALQTYSQGHGERGSNTWRTNARIAQALEEAFYKSFANVKASGKRILLGIDISGSMRSNVISGLSEMPATWAAAAQTLVTVNAEPFVDVVAFDTHAYPRVINKRSTILATMKEFAPQGGTDCGSVIQYAQDNNLVYDAFVIFTDGETWANNSNPYNRFKAYQYGVNNAAKLITVAMVGNRYSLSPANDDASVFDCVGFDATTPQLISEFLAGHF